VKLISLAPLCGGLIAVSAEFSFFRYLGLNIRDFYGIQDIIEASIFFSLPFIGAFSIYWGIYFLIFGPLIKNMVDLNIKADSNKTLGITPQKKRRLIDSSVYLLFVIILIIGTITGYIPLSLSFILVSISICMLLLSSLPLFKRFNSSPQSNAILYTLFASIVVLSFCISAGIQSAERIFSGNVDRLPTVLVNGMQSNDNYHLIRSLSKGDLLLKNKDTIIFQSSNNNVYIKKLHPK
jgi:hypothetical protein